MNVVTYSKFNSKIINGVTGTVLNINDDGSYTWKTANNDKGIWEITSDNKLKLTTQSLEKMQNAEIADYFLLSNNRSILYAQEFSDGIVTMESWDLHIEYEKAN